MDTGPHPRSAAQFVVGRLSTSLQRLQNDSCGYHSMMPFWQGFIVAFLNNALEDTILECRKLEFQCRSVKKQNPALPSVFSDQPINLPTFSPPYLSSPFPKA
jgi:hypothetical protein